MYNFIQTSPFIVVPRIAGNIGNWTKRIPRWFPVGILYPFLSHPYLCHSCFYLFITLPPSFIHFFFTYFMFLFLFLLSFYSYSFIPSFIHLFILSCAHLFFHVFTHLLFHLITFLFHSCTNFFRCSKIHLHFKLKNYQSFCFSVAHSNYCRI